jgi:protein tyrosine phosphatase
MNEFSSPLIFNQLSFGKYPTQNQVNLLREEGFNMIVNLTEEMSIFYYFPLTIKYPINDTKTPDDLDSFSDLLQLLLDSLENGKKIFIHCRHGRGRSGTVTAILLILYFDLSYEESIQVLNLNYQQGHGYGKVKKSIPSHGIQRELIKSFG